MPVPTTITWRTGTLPSSCFVELALRRPLLFFDLETTGIDVVTSRIVQIALIQVFEDGSSREWDTLVNPTIHIPQATTAVHGITDDMVKDAPTFQELAPLLAPLFQDADLAGYNSTRFDVPMILEEFMRAGYRMDFSQHVLLDAHRIFTQKEPRTLTAAYRFYCDGELMDAHTAIADTRAAAEVLLAQLQIYDDLPSNIIELGNYCNNGQHILDFSNRLVYNEKNEIVFNFGKYKGQSVKEVFKLNDGYYGWIMQSDFSSQMKEIVTKIYRELHNA